MGIYLNPGNEGFQRSLRSRIFVDKTMLIQKMNRIIRTEQRYVCVSRPRQFGKTMALEMLSAYYSQAENSGRLFDGLRISGDASFNEHMGRYDVIRVNMQRTSPGDLRAGLEQLKAYLVDELIEAHGAVRFRRKDDLAQVMADIFAGTGRSFVILIDEWDAPLREKSFMDYEKKDYLDFLRNWLKDQDYVALAYMTGLMPVGRYETGSALNMFSDYSMLSTGDLAGCFGFTETEAGELCARCRMSYEDTKKWYGGYESDRSGSDDDAGHSVFHPRSVVEAMLRRCFGAYWNREEECAEMEEYLNGSGWHSEDNWGQNEIGTGMAIEQLLAGESVEISVGVGNSCRLSRDEWLTLLVYLGYLIFDREKGTVSIPNREALRVLSNIRSNCAKTSPAYVPDEPDEPLLLTDDPETYL